MRWRWRGNKILLYFTRVSSALWAKADKVLQGSPLTKSLFAAPVCTYQKLHNQYLQCFLLWYTRYLYEIITYLEWKYIRNKLTFLRYYVDAGGKRLTAVIMWENKLAPNNLLFFPPTWKYIHQWRCVFKDVYRARANAISHQITCKRLESRHKKGLPISGGFGCITLLMDF